jgi:DNA-directed RNA polymerase subunit RPC12/RpoP
MYKERWWSEDEVVKLRFLYVSGRPFEEIKDALPRRTSNAIRQKASRLGLRRPVESNSLCDSQMVLRCSDGNGDGDDYLFKCSLCGHWIRVDFSEEAEDRVIVCPRCQSTCRYVV